MAKERNAFYGNCSAAYSVSIFQSKDWRSKPEQLVRFSCAHCKRWQDCESADEKMNMHCKRDICYIAKDVENKLLPLIYGFSSGISNSDFFVLAENAEQEKGVDKVRKRLLRKYKMDTLCRG